MRGRGTQSPTSVLPVPQAPDPPHHHAILCRHREAISASYELYVTGVPWVPWALVPADSRFVCARSTCCVHGLRCRNDSRNHHESTPDPSRMLRPAACPSVAPHGEAANKPALPQDATSLVSALCARARIASEHGGAAREDLAQHSDNFRPVPLFCASLHATTETASGAPVP